jgi:NPCBM-associated, NEW3 domain of alpha-galactosidase
LQTLLYGWLVALWRLLLALIAAATRPRKAGGTERDRRASRARCVPIDHPAFRRPDPLIYDQYYLSSLGLAVTWDNPDIQLFRGKEPVSSSLLDPDTDYTVVARIWNASFGAPVVQMPVHFSYLDFGMGAASMPIGTTQVTIGVKGSASEPGYAAMTWHTPKADGHYCLQVEFEPADDANFANNLGQENTNVGHATSPVTFTFVLRNDTKEQHHYRFELDAYEIPPRGACDPRKDTDDERRRRALAHKRGQFPVPDGWTVEITPAEPVLAPGEQVEETAVVTPPETFVGSQRINVNAWREQDFAGGVTLIVKQGVA